jgi:hypothetical protein
VATPLLVGAGKKTRRQFMVNDANVVEFPYERQAIRGEEMPDGLSFVEQEIYQSFRMLYAQYKMKILDRETASREKQKILREYVAGLVVEKIGRDFADQHRTTELARQAYRKNRTLENADALILAFEGVPVVVKPEVL